MKILIYSDNKWVIESIEKYIDFDYELLENVDLESLNQRIDYIFVDMQVKIWWTVNNKRVEKRQNYQEYSNSLNCRPGGG